MKFDTNIINGLIKYKKGENIPNPDNIYVICKIPKVIRDFFNVKKGKVLISARSVAHILQKGKIGQILINSIIKCLNSFDAVFLSDKAKTPDTKRYILFKKKANNFKDIGVVIELRKNDKNIYVITAMIADEKYLHKKYKKLR
jgi:hypothetical protein